MSAPDDTGLPTREKMLAAVDGDAELLGLVAAMWLEEGPSSLETVREAVHSQNPEALERAAHAFKGSAAIFRYEPMVRLAQRLEDLGASGSVDAEARATLDELTAASDRLAVRLEEILGG